MHNHFISYAQNFEDVMLWRALRHVQNGFYVDVGANDPEVDSVTNHFYKNGWSGINIEPSPTFYKKLLHSRPKDINLNLGAGDKQSKLTFFEIPNTGLSTFNRQFAENAASQLNQITEIEVEVDTLNNVFSKLNPKEIHFLKIDVEGFEYNVLKGLNLSKWKPWILVIESTIPNTATENATPWEDQVLQAGFKQVYFDGINKFYLSNDHLELAHLFKAPPNPLDDFYLHANHHLYHPDDHDRKDLRSYLQEVEAWAEAAQEWGNTLESQCYELATSLDSANVELSHLRTALNNLHNSSSWKITKPLRIISDALKKVISLALRVIKKILRPFKPTIRKIIRKLIYQLQGYPKFYTTLKQCIPNSLIQKFKSVSQDINLSPTSPGYEAEKNENGVDVQISIYEKIENANLSLKKRESSK